MSTVSLGPYSPDLDTLNIAPLNGFAAPQRLARQNLWTFLTNMLVRKIYLCSCKSFSSFSRLRLLRFYNLSNSSFLALNLLQAFCIAKAALNLLSSSPLYWSCFFWISSIFYLSSSELYLFLASLPLHTFYSFKAAMIYLNSPILLFKPHSIWFNRAKSCI